MQKHNECNIAWRIFSILNEVTEWGLWYSFVNIRVSYSDLFYTLQWKPMYIKTW